MEQKNIMRELIRFLPDLPACDMVMLVTFVDLTFAVTD
uniref:Uncharacterized protein n=1 Tax=Anguilla anguilla TaxID=7936 RepID=A0A0E9W8P5_ANGAN